MLQNEWQPTILDRLYQIMFKIIILSQIGADRYQKNHFRNTTFVPPLESCAVVAFMPPLLQDTDIVCK